MRGCITEKIPNLKIQKWLYGMRQLRELENWKISVIDAKVEKAKIIEERKSK